MSKIRDSPLKTSQNDKGPINYGRSKVRRDSSINSGTIHAFCDNYFFDQISKEKLENVQNMIREIFEVPFFLSRLIFRKKIKTLFKRTKKLSKSNICLMN